MAITKRSSSTLTSGSRTNSTVPAPAGSATGDYIVVALLVGNSASVVPATPAGWTLLGSVAYSAPDPWTVNLRLYGRFFDGAGSWVWTHSAATSQAFASAYTGVDAATPLDVTAVTAFQDQAAVDGPPAAVAPPVTIVTANVMEFIARGSWDGNAITPPAGWTEEHDTPILWVGDRLQASTGATGTIDVPHGNGGPNPDRLPWGIIHAALRPTSGGGSFPASGTSASTTAVAGAVTSRLPASGTATSTSSVTGALTLNAGLAGTVTAATAVAGSVTSRLPAAGATESTSTVSGAVQGRYPAAGTIPAVSTVAGDMTAPGGMQGTVTSSSAVTGAVSARLPAAGDTGSSSTVTGVVEARYVVSGVVTATSTVTGTIQPTGARDITVTARLDSRRWAGAMVPATRTGTLRTRWKGTT